MLDDPLYDLKAGLRIKYPSLVFVEGTDSSFIQVFKPYSRLEFLPNFSVIVTINDGLAKFSLLTFHGKVLGVETSNFPFKEDNLRLMEMISNEELDVCQGFKQFSQIGDVTLESIKSLSQNWRSPILLETFGNLITMRSGQCSYIGKRKMCSECQSLNQDSNELEIPNCEVKIEEVGNDDSRLETFKKLGFISETLGESHEGTTSKHSTLLTLDTSFEDAEDFSFEEESEPPRRRTRGKRSKTPKKSPTKKSKVKDDNQSYQCEVCCLIFVERYRYLRCMARHEEVFDLKQSTICPVCKKSIESKLKVTEHFKDFHGDMGETCCCECLKLIHKEDGELRKHILKEHHSARKAYLCSDCGKEYKSSDNLQAHIRQIHQKITSFVCSYCGDTFARLNTLKSHMLSHKPPTLKCLYCEKMFRKKDLLIKHLQLHTKFKPLKCKNCNYFSDRRGNIRLHFEKSHGKKWNENDMEVNMVEYRQMRRIVLQEASKIVKEAKEREKQQ